jgi:hypothetical protein
MPRNRILLKHKNRLIVKYNSGNGAILCSGCAKILKVGHEYTDEERQYALGKLHYLPPQFCDECVIKVAKTTQNV